MTCATVRMSTLRLGLSLLLGVSAAAAQADCGLPFTSIPAVQGSGAASPLVGSSVTVQGVVVGDYQGPSPALRGFYLQDPLGDGDPATSDGIFVFNGSNNAVVSLGQLVRATGTVSEFQGQTQISTSDAGIQICGSATVTPTDVYLPVASLDDLERFEGMLVRLPQTLFVTEHFQLGRFGQIVLSVEGRQMQPTHAVMPGAAAQALQAQNLRGRLIFDDGDNGQNRDPIVFGRGGLPLSAANTLRGGDTTSGIVGVMTYTWAGNAASGNAWRVRPLGALGASLPDFQPTNPRPAAAPLASGSLRVAGFNVLNYFNNVSGCTAGVGGPAVACRGAGSDAGSAANQAAQFVVEFPRQAAKTVAALVKMNADVVGLVEIENDGYGPNSALRDLVDRLNAATSPGRYTLLDVDARTGQINAMGTDAIKVAFIYQPARVKPVGQTAALNSVAFVNGGDPAERNRPALAQAWEQPNGARFIAVVNHLKSKGSACSLPDQGDGQGNCNQVRLHAATELRHWLATNPTATHDPDILILGDLNAYAQEDPIRVFTDAGWRDLIFSYGGAAAYGYVFNGQWGYLDHALATPSLAHGQIAGATHWKISADEPSALDYNVNFKSAGQIASLFAPDEFRNADHDPVVVDLALTPPNRIQGTPGNDMLTGTPGDDILVGGPGRDRLTGGEGRDQFVFESALDGVDTIIDFQPGLDVIHLRKLLVSLSRSSANPFVTGVITCTPAGNGALIGIDLDGSAGPLRNRPLVLLAGHGCATVLVPANFLY